MQSEFIYRQWQVYWPNNRNKKLLSPEISSLTGVGSAISTTNMEVGSVRRPTEPTGPVAIIYSCQEEGFSLITLAIASFPETGRVCRWKRQNKERMNGRMKERKG